jgi:hypothetical protein
MAKHVLSVHNRKFSNFRIASALASEPPGENKMI